MDASVLGLKIVLIKEGYKELLEINGDPSWTKKVWDIRRDLPAGTNTEEGKTALLLSGVESGTIITVAACIEGRQNDCIIAWIFVPTNIEISGKQLVNVIDDTSKELMANERNDAKLQQVFEKRYSVNNILRTSIVSSGEQFAFRKYGKGCGYQLYELLTNPDQVDYRHYKGVFLIDSNSGITANGTDISNQQLKEFVRIDEIPSIHGFQPFINNHSMTDPISLPEGDEIIIVWKRSGYKTIEKKWVVRNGEKVPTIAEPDFKVVVPFEKFIVLDESTDKPIQDYNIKINNNCLEKDRPYYVSEAAVRDCDVSIEAPDYNISKKVCDLSINQITIRLERKRYTYDWIVKFLYADNRYADLHLETEVKLNDRSPIAGYRIDPHNNNRLLYSPFGKKQKIFALLILSIVLLLGLIGGMFLSDAIKKDYKGSESVTATISSDCPPHGQSKKTNEGTTEVEKIISYLDSNIKWNREEMERYSKISGLWEALNERRFDDILKYQEQLNGSKKFNELVEAVNANKHKTFQQNFNSRLNDYDITIGSKNTSGSYIKKLYDAPEPNKPSKSN